MLLASIEERGLPGDDGTLLTICTCDPACPGDNAVELRKDCRMATKVATRFERQERQTTVAGEVGTTEVTGTDAHELVDQAAWSTAEFKDPHGQQHRVIAARRAALLLADRERHRRGPTAAPDARPSGTQERLPFARRQRRLRRTSGVSVTSMDSPADFQLGSSTWLVGSTL